MQLNIVQKESSQKSFRQEMTDYIRGNFADVLGEDAALLDTEAGLAELSRMTLKMYREAVAKAA